jgi:soluble lytic murein transglycosylase-like protein
MRLAVLLAGLALACATQVARADIYGYIDAEGNAHFAAEKLDERYQLFMRGDGAFDSDKLTAPAPAIAAAPQGPLQRYLAQHPNLKKYEPLMTQAAHDYAVELPLLKAVMAAESGFNAAAISPKGAIGLMQVMPATAERYGLQADKRKSLGEKLADPKTNIRLGARYLRDLMRLFPDQLTLVLASYNAGEGAVQKYRNSVPPYPETQNYVKLVTQFYQLYKPAPPAIPAQAGAANGRVTLTLPGRANLPTRSVPEQ